MARSSERWRDHQRGNRRSDGECSVRICSDARQVKCDGAISDRDPMVAQDGARALIDAYNKLYLENEGEASRITSSSLTAWRDQYTARKRTLIDRSRDTSNVGRCDQGALRLQIQETNAAESAWHLVSGHCWNGRRCIRTGQRPRLQSLHRHFSKIHHRRYCHDGSGIKRMLQERSRLRHEIEGSTLGRQTQCCEYESR